MEYAEFYYVTTLWSIEKIAKLMGQRYSVVRDHLFTRFPQSFNRHRKSLCYAKSKYGKQNPMSGKHPSNYRGLCSDGKGYLTVCKPQWYTGRKRYARVFAHHVVICEHIGLSEIPRGFCVHHVDGNPQNNKISNLALMTLSAHAILHRLSGSSETIRKRSRVQENSKRVAQAA